MLDDRARTESFLAAFREVVSPGDVVVEIGTGTGILTLAAVRAGAKRVYTIEEGGLAEAASAIFEANGMSDRITLVRGSSTRVDLPERGDILISEILGDDPLGERLFEVTLDAVKRLVKPEARLVPATIRIFGLPVTIPRERLTKWVFDRDNVGKWRSWYGVDLSPLATAGHGNPAYFRLDSRRASEWKPLSRPVLLAEADLKANRTPVVDVAREVTATASGRLNGILVYFEADLEPTTALSLHPLQVRAGNHWRSRVWILPEPCALRLGDRFELQYAPRLPGRPDGVRVAFDRGGGIEDEKGGQR